MFLFKGDKTCQYRSQSCWFKHTDILNGNMERNISKSGNDIEHIENKSEVIQKLVEMVEKYTERILILENMMIK